MPRLLSLVAGWITFCYIYVIIPRQRESWRIIMIAALLGAVGLGILQYGTTLLFEAFSGNAAAAIFGPVIVLMLFFNLFAQLILILAAWIATWDEPAFQPTWTREWSGSRCDRRRRRRSSTRWCPRRRPSARSGSVSAPAG